MANSGLGGALGVAKTGITERLPVTARKTPPNGWMNVRAFLTPGTFEFTVPEQVWQIALHVNGGGGNASTAASGAGGGFAYGVLDVFPGQVIRNIVVGGVAGTSSIAGLLSATGGTSASGATPGTAGNGTILSRALRLTETASGDPGNANSSGGNAGRRVNTLTFTKSGLVALINGELSGNSSVISTVQAAPNGTATISGETGQDGQRGQSVTGQGGGNTTNGYGGRGGVGAGGGDATGQNALGTFVGGPGGFLGGGGFAQGGASNQGGQGGPGGGGGYGTSAGGSGGPGIILIGWTLGY